MVQNPKAHGGPPEGATLNEPTVEFTQPRIAADVVSQPVAGIDEPITGDPFATQTFATFTFGEG